MSKQNNLKPILIVLGGLVAILALIQFMDKKSERSFKEFVVQVDTAVVNTIEITPKGESKPVVLVKEDGRWMVSMDTKKVQADEASTGEILKQVAALKADKVASTSKEKWSSYEVTDSAGTRVVVKNNKKVLADFYSGKFSFDRNTRSMTSYVRNVKENETYAVDGYMSMMFNRAKGGFRATSLISGNSASWKKLSFNYPADSSFVMEKSNGHWQVNGMPADSVKVQNYLGKISRLNSQSFDDAVEIAQSQIPVYSVTIETETGKPIEVKGFVVDGKMVFTSSVSEGNVYNQDKIAQELLVGSRSFLP